MSVHDAAHLLQLAPEPEGNREAEPWRTSHIKIESSDKGPPHIYI